MLGNLDLEKSVGYMKSLVYLVEALMFEVRKETPRRSCLPLDWKAAAVVDIYKSNSNSDLGGSQTNCY